MPSDSLSTLQSHSQRARQHRYMVFGKVVVVVVVVVGGEGGGGGVDCMDLVPRGIIPRSITLKDKERQGWTCWRVGLRDQGLAVDFSHSPLAFSSLSSSASPSVCLQSALREL